VINDKNNKTLGGESSRTKASEDNMEHPKLDEDVKKIYLVL